MWEVGQHAGRGRRLEDGERNLVMLPIGRRLEEGERVLVRGRSGRRLEEGERDVVRERSGRGQAGHSCRLSAPPAAPLRPGEVCSSSSFGVGHF